MAKIEAVIDCAIRAIIFTTPEKKRIRFRLTFEPKGPNLNHLKGVSPDEKCQL